MKINLLPWRVLVPMALLLLLLAALVLPPLPKPKARAQRVSAVNSIPNLALTQPATGASSGGPNSARP